MTFHDIVMNNRELSYVDAMRKTLDSFKESLNTLEGNKYDQIPKNHLLDLIEAAYPEEGIDDEQWNSSDRSGFGGYNYNNTNILYNLCQSIQIDGCQVSVEFIDIFTDLYDSLVQIGALDYGSAYHTFCHLTYHDLKNLKDMSGARKAKISRIQNQWNNLLDTVIDADIGEKVTAEAERFKKETYAIAFVLNKKKELLELRNDCNNSYVRYSDATNDKLYVSSLVSICHCARFIAHQNGDAEKASEIDELERKAESFASSNRRVFEGVPELESELVEYIKRFDRPESPISDEYLEGHRKDVIYYADIRPDMYNINHDGGIKVVKLWNAAAGNKHAVLTVRSLSESNPRLYYGAGEEKLINATIGSLAKQFEGAGISLDQVQMNAFYGQKYGDAVIQARVPIDEYKEKILPR